MASRVLIADDSLTIQKVIGITLANSGYELIECTNEEDLLSKVKSNHFDLVLLDFNLSDTRSGYDLAKQIFNINSNTGIIVMLGTFDSIDETQFASCGIADKIVKPFESSKFIKKCRDLLEGIKERPAALSDLKLESESKKSSQDVLQNNNENIDDLDLWTLDAPRLNSKSPNSEESSDENLAELSLMNKGSRAPQLDPLSSEIAGWGFSANNNLEEKFNKTFPPVIEESNPDFIIDRLQSSSTFVTSTLAKEHEEETNPSFELPEDLNRGLLVELEEEASPEAFWAVDEIVPLKAEEYTDIVNTNLDEITSDLTESVKNFRASEKTISKEEIKETVDRSSSNIAGVDQDELIEKLKVSLRPVIEELVREFCRQNAEKVAWEIIPDLAENLIRKELKEISDSIKH